MRTAPSRIMRTPLRARGGVLVALLSITIGAAGLADVSGGAAIKAKAALAQVLLKRAWARTLEGEAEVRPWPWADVWPVLKIEAPRHNVSAIALSGVSGEAMAFGPGVMKGGVPAPGEPGLAVIAAHRDTHFRFLKDVEIGDELIVTNAQGERMVFAVSQTRIVNAAQSGLYAGGAIPEIALVTCWPFDAVRRGDQRFVAIGVRKQHKRNYTQPL